MAEAGARGRGLWRVVCSGLTVWLSSYLACSVHMTFGMCQLVHFFERQARVPAREVFNPPPVPPGRTPVRELCPGGGRRGRGPGTCVVTPAPPSWSRDEDA